MNGNGDSAAALRAELRPLVEALVREEVERAGFTWRWRTVPQVAALLGISEAAVRQRIRRGRLPARKLDGLLYVDVADLDKAISNGDSPTRRGRSYDDPLLTSQWGGTAPTARP